MSPTVPPISVMTTSTSSAGQAVDAPLDLVGDVRDHLHGLAEVVAAPLGGEHRRVDRAGGGVRVAGQALVDEALVVAEIEVGLAAVVGDEHLAVLERVHGAGVDVDVRVELLHGDPEAPGLEQSSERRGREALPQRGGHPTRHEDVFRHGRLTHIRRRRPLTPVRWLPTVVSARGAAVWLRRAAPAAWLAGRRRCPASRTASGTARRRGRSPSSDAARARWSSPSIRASSPRPGCRRTPRPAAGG